jgi:hypothetical protein
MEVAFVPAAEDELGRLPVSERIAILNAIEKLDALGDRLPYPHSSAVKGTKLRELRPRSGRSPWRAFYRRVDDMLIVAAIGPEAQSNPSGFNRAVTLAEQRIAEYEE